MNIRLKVFSIATIIAVSAIDCKKDNINKGNTTLAGRWLEIGGYISSGGPQYWVKATGKNYLQFNASGTMQWDENKDFVTYSVKDSITLKMNNADDTTYEDFFYRIRHDTLMISPRAPYECIEGCSTVFIKMGNNF